MSATASTTTIPTATATTLIGFLPTMTGAADVVSEKNCPACGQGVHQSPDEAQRRIKELESQVRNLSDGASRTAEKLSNYEDELTRLRFPRNSHSQKNKNSVSSSISSAPSEAFDSKQQPSSPFGVPSTAQSSPSSPTSQSHHPSPYSQSRLSAFASLLHYRRSAAAPPLRPSSIRSQQQQGYIGSDSTTSELQNALNREQALRKSAETQLSQVNTELEELTVQLFSEANEMVSRERRERAKLEERVSLLEKRDVDKRGRLERLEKAIARVERVRALVG